MGAAAVHRGISFFFFLIKHRLCEVNQISVVYTTLTQFPFISSFCCAFISLLFDTSFVAQFLICVFVKQIKRVLN